MLDGFSYSCLTEWTNKTGLILVNKLMIGVLLCKISITFTDLFIAHSQSSRNGQWVDLNAMDIGINVFLHPRLIKVLVIHPLSICRVGTKSISFQLPWIQRHSIIVKMKLYYCRIIIYIVVTHVIIVSLCFWQR